VTKPPSTRTATTLSIAPIEPEDQSGAAIDLDRLDREHLGADDVPSRRRHEPPCHPYMGCGMARLTRHRRSRRRTSGARKSSRLCRSPVSTPVGMPRAQLGSRPEKRPRVGGARRRVRAPGGRSGVRRRGSCRRLPRSRRTGSRNTSRSTNTARSVGVSVSSTSSIAIETCQPTRRPRLRQARSAAARAARDRRTTPCDRRAYAADDRLARCDPDQICALVRTVSRSTAAHRSQSPGGRPPRPPPSRASRRRR